MIFMSLITTLFYVGQTSCDVFTPITTPETESMDIEQDISFQVVKDYGWGVWTRYRINLASIDQLGMKQQDMHIVSEVSDDYTYLIYFISIDRTQGEFYHKLYVAQDEDLQIRELSITQRMVGDNWVFFYFCYSEANQYYNIFLYISNDDEYVQMSQGGPYIIQNSQIKEYILGGSRQVTNAFDKNINLNLTTFAGEISNMDLRSAMAYEDIDTFLANLDKVECVLNTCLMELKSVITDNLIFDGIPFQNYKLNYIQNKFNIYGWVKVNPLDTPDTVESVFMRASLRKQYYNDQILGDKAFYWKYQQSNQLTDLNGLTFTTYHFDPLNQDAYQTTSDDSWILNQAYYSTMITFWHWFIYSEGMSGANNTQLYIYFGQSNSEITLQKNLNHYDKSKLYLKLGGDTFNSNFRGVVRNLAFTYCYSRDYEPKRICHISCKTCFGPFYNNCLECLNPLTSHRMLIDGQCICQSGYIDIGLDACQPRLTVLKNIEIKEDVFENTECKFGQFNLPLNGQSYCLECPSKSSISSLTCIDCLINPDTWYLNPKCTIDYFQPNQDDTLNVFQEAIRQKIDEEYFLINVENNVKSVESCSGCLGKDDNAIEFISRKTLNVVQRIICKVCYSIINNECINLNEHCLECSNLNDCFKCETNYTVFNGICYKCPIYCPNCFKNNTDYYCNECITGYYHNKTSLQCQQCGQLCAVCVPTYYNKNELECIKCVDEMVYFISADRQSCRVKTIQNCDYQGQEYLESLFNLNLTYQDVMFSSSMDVYSFSDTSQPAYDVCFLCKDKYINKMFLYIIGGAACLSPDDVPNLPNALKQQVLNSENYSYQLVYFQDMFRNPQSQSFQVIFGKSVQIEQKNSQNQILNVTYESSVITRQTIDEIVCDNARCVNCLKNFKWTSSFCIQCEKGYYASMSSGNCYLCPSECDECLEQHQVYQDGWKWKLRPYQHFRSLQLYGFHNFNDYNVDSDVLQYGPYCTSCKEDQILQNGKCYKKCNCPTCVLQNEIMTCVKCSNGLQNVLNGNCVECPKYCSLCRYLSDQEILQINPYFNITNSDFKSYALKCIKQTQTNPSSGILFHDISIGLMINCLNNQKKDCYRYLEFTQNVYCSDEIYYKEYQNLPPDEQQDFQSNNALLSTVFSNQPGSHFKDIESDPLYRDLNENGVKLIRLILKIKENTGSCVINSDTFVTSDFRKYIFPLKYLEIQIESSFNTPLIIGNNISFYEFTTVTFKNVLLDNIIGPKTINLNNIFGIDFNLQTLRIQNSPNLQLQFIIQNPNSINLQDIQIQDSTIQNLNGLIQYYFTRDLQQQFNYQIDSFQLINTIILNSQIIVQILNEKIGNQILQVNNLLSESSSYSNSTLLYTQFFNTQRQSNVKISNFESKSDSLTNSSFCFLQGALQVTLNNLKIKDGLFYKQAKLFKLPLFTLVTFMLQNCNFTSIDNRVFTNNIEVLYSDNLQNNLIQMEDLHFISNEYVAGEVFIELIQNRNFQNLKVNLQNIYLQLNRLNAKIMATQFTTLNATMYFNLLEITIINFQIVRGVGLPEISISNTDLINIQNLTATLDPKYRLKLLHNQFTCLAAFQELGFGGILCIYNAKQTNLRFFTLENLQTINQPLISFKSIQRQQIRKQETISVSNFNLNSNTLIITRLSEQQSIISILSEQEQQITLQQISALLNYQHSYFEDLKVKQSSTIVVSNPYSTITLKQSYFQGNVVLNSQNSNLMLIGGSIRVADTIFENQNFFQYSRVKQELIWGYSSSDNLYVEHLQTIFPIKSKGGSLFLQADEITLQNITCSNSYGMQGGAIYILAQDLGVIEISESKFTQNSASMKQNENAQGGSIFIDASQASLYLTISTNTFQYSQSRKEGGLLYVEPSRSFNLIKIVKNIFNDVYSLYYPLIRLPVLFTSNQLQLNVELDNCSISNSDSGFLNFLGQIQNLSKTEISDQKMNYLVYIDKGNISLTNILVQNVFAYGVLNLNNVYSLLISDFSLENCTLISQSLINISPAQKFNFTTKIQNIKLTQIQEFQVSLDDQSNSIPSLQYQSFKCQNSLSQPQTLPYFFTDNILQTLTKTNYYLIMNSNYQVDCLIGIDQIQKNHQITITQSQIQNITCPSCSSGILKLTNIFKVTTKSNIQITDISLSDNLCGLSCIVLSSKKTNQIKLSNSNRQYRILANLENIYENQVATIRIENLLIKNNIANYGGAALISSIDAIIYNCQFINNSASKAGGAIYVEYQSGREVYIYNTLILNNNATIGGGLYLGEQALNQPSKLNNQVINNYAAFYGQNIASKPIQLTLKVCDKLLSINRIVLNSTNITDQIEVSKYYIGKTPYDYLTIPSGQTIGEYLLFNEHTKEFVSWNQTLRIVALNDEKDEIKSLIGSKCYLSVNNTQQSIVLSFSEVLFNTSSQDYNLDSLIVTLDSEEYLQLEVQCDSIGIPQFSEQPPYKFKFYFNNYRMRVNLRTFPCQKGEYKTEQGACKLCDSKSDQYTIIAGQRCQIKDQITIEQVTPARVKLRSQYWRPYEESQKIEYCLNMPENCVGGWDPGNSLCSFAHIGALCEQCDLYNIRGQGSFSVSTQYVCGSCEGVGNNSVKIALISLWTMISILLSVKGTVESIENMIAEEKLKKFRLCATYTRAGYGSVLIKVLTNYLQIIGSIATFQLKLPSLLQSSLRSVGNPVESMSFSLDCFLKTLTNIDNTYFRMIWALIMPMIYINIFLFGYMITLLLKFTQFNRSAITTTFIYLFTYLQPTLLGGFISLISYRIISNVPWIQGNVAYRYDTNVHQNWILSFILPSILLLGVVIPLFMLFSLYQRRNQLNHEITRKNWGYLYNEYQPHAYFWEIIKIYQKGFIIVFLTFYEDLIIIKASLVFLIVFIYQLMTKNFKPYKLPYLNFIDEFGTIICRTSIVLGMAIYQANNFNNQEIIWPSYIILIGINLVFILIILWEIVQVQINDQQEKLDKIRDLVNKKYPKLKKRYRWLGMLLENRQKQKQRITKRFQKVRQYLMTIVKKNSKIYAMPPKIDYQQEINTLLLYIQDDSNMKKQNSPSLPVSHKIYPTSIQSSIDDNQ